ncbi:MAG: c-type cytochrome [Acidobacteria bacterium]|nr:c-type cytochrome [Acidobacteriota bacterium]
MWFARIMLVAAVASAQERAAKNPHTTPVDVAAGARIFRSHCAECHGLKGEGGRGPSLTTGVFFHGGTDADLLRNITGGIPGTAMPGVFFSEDQVWQIVAYVRSLGRTGSTLPPSGDAARGRKVFEAQRCLDCHLVRGEGGVQGPDLSVIGSQRSVEHLRQAILDPNAQVAREYRVARATHENNSAYSGFLMNEDTHYLQILDFSRGLTSLVKRDLRQLRIENNSLMPSYKERLSEGELQDLLAYLWSLRRGPLEEGGSK